MPAAEVRRVRALAVSVASAAGLPRQRRMPLMAALATGLAIATVAGLWVVGRGDSAPVAVTAGGDAREVDAAVAERRQLLFSMPGGTRVIWVFDPSFEMR
jgi:hypothetical protein